MAWVAKAGELYTRLTLRDSKFRTGLSKTLHRLRPLGQAMMRVSRIARNMLLGGLGLGALAVRSAIKFESSMARIRAITNVTGKDFTKLTNIALKLGRTTVWTAGQAAEAQEKLARAGFDTREIVDTLPATLNLATAAQMDLATAAQISSGILRGMKLPTDQARNAMDVLAAAANSSNTNVAELGNGMRFIGPIAVQTGHSLEETVAIMQTLADVQIRGSMAGTSLRRMLAGLAGGSKPVIKLMKKFGVETAAVGGKMRPVADIIDDLNARMADLTDMEKAAEIMQAFGQRAGPATVELLARGGNAIREYQHRLEEAAGVADRMARVQLNTLQGAFTRLRSAIEGLMIKTGSAFTKMLRRWVETLISLVEVLNDLNEEQLEKFHGWIKKIGIALAALWIGPPLLRGIGKLLAWIGGGTVVGGLGILAAKIGAIAQAVRFLVIDFKVATVGITGLFTAIKAGAVALLAKLGLIGVIIAEVIAFGWELYEIFTKRWKAKKLAFDLAIYSKTLNRLMEELTAASESRRKAEEKGGKNYAAALEREIAIRKRMIELEEREIDNNKHLGDAVREGKRLLIAKYREFIRWAEKALGIAEKQAELEEKTRKAKLERGLAGVGAGAPASAQAAKDLGHKFIGVTEMWKTLSTVGLTTEQKQLETERRILEENKKQTTSLRILAQRAGLPMQVSGDMFNPQPALSVVP